MSARIVLAPVGAGKTEVALTQLISTLEAQPFARVWVLLASKRQEDAFRHRLIEWNPARKIYFNVEFFNFYDLYQRLLDGAGQPPRHLTDTARYGVLRRVIDDLYWMDEISVFGGIAHTPGFVRIVAEFIYELKQNRVYPDEFALAGRTSKDRELALIYAGYQDKLRRYNLVDKEGQGWLAVEALVNNRDLAGDLTLLLVDGFDQFTPVQADLLALLADRAIDSTVTLTTVPGRETIVGRRFEETKRLFEERFPAVETQYIRHADAERHYDLQRLVDEVFLPKVQPMPSSGGLHLIEAPDPASEVASVLRKVKRLLLDGCAPDDILIALRDWSRYQAHFAAYGKAYKLPLVSHYGDPLLENPAVVALLSLISLHERDFRRRDVLDALRSPYFAIPALTDSQVALLEKISLQHHVMGGRNMWLDAIAQASRGKFNEDESAEELPLLTVDEAEFLIADLDTFFKAVTPPEFETVAGYIRWLERLMGEDQESNRDADLPSEEFEIEQGGYSVDMIARLRDSAAGSDIVTRDLGAIQAFKHVLRGLLTSRELLRSLENAAEDISLEWAAFATDLLAAVASATVDSHPNRSGRVLVTTATDARGLPHKHVFIVGLSEGIFPQQIPEDPLYLDSERRALRARGIRLKTQAERAADDGLFYELICLPRESLTLSRSTVQEGKRWVESVFWRAVTIAFTNSADLIQRDRLRVGQVVPAAEVATLDEAVLTVSAGFNVPFDLVKPTEAGLYNWLLTKTPYWAGIRRGRLIEAGRISTNPYDLYSGRLQDNRLVEYAAGQLGTGKVWSASQLNDYGVCGFRYFAKRLLKLEAIKEPEEGMDAAQRGTLNHEILEKTYAHFLRQGITITPDHIEDALRTLRTVAHDVFNAAPEKIGFRADALWTQEQAILLRKLESLVRVDFSADSPINKKFGHIPRVPYQLEAPFGMDEDQIVTIALDDGEALQVRGYIDRIDRAENRAIIIDYKTGSTTIPISEISEGRNFQMMVYALASETLLKSDPDAPEEVAGGLFWHVSNSKISGDLHLDDSIGQEALEQGRAHLTRYLAQGRAGDFATHANKLQEGKCVRYCEFSQLCRMSIMSRKKRD